MSRPSTRRRTSTSTGSWARSSSSSGSGPRPAPPPPRSAAEGIVLSPRPIGVPVEGITDGVVRLRLIADADIPAITRACQDPAIQRYTTVPSPYEERHAREWLTAAAAGMSAGTDLALLVVDAGKGDLLGSVGLHSIDPATGRCSAGYWVTEAARGRHVAKRALRLLCRFGFDELDLRRIELWIEPENTGSVGVAESLGFVREGVLRSFMVVGGRRRDMLMYSLLPGDVA
ncbi:MAG TPA: GNAT family protein [Solirubrobacterales bacterium]|nr:GNAT family protein [Solirubrobacterales bacterium]